MLTAKPPDPNYGLPLSLLDRLTFWPLQIAGWLAVLIFVLAAWSLGGFPDPMVGWLSFVRAPSGFLLTTVLHPLCRRVAITRPPPLLVLAAIVPASLLGGYLEVISNLWVAELCGLNFAPLAEHGLWPSILLVRASGLFIWLVLYFGLKWLQHASATEREFQQAELRLLRSQLNPHILFNVLTTIIAMRRDADEVERLTQALADYLAFYLRPRDAHTDGAEKIALGEELDALGCYLTLEKSRFGEDLVWSIAADARARAALVPPAIVQPLVENAIKHGQATSPRPLVIDVNATATDGTLQVSVVNTGRWVEPAPGATTGIGLANLRRRLVLLHDTRAALRIANRPDRVRVDLELPLQDPS